MNNGWFLCKHDYISHPFTAWPTISLLETWWTTGISCLSSHVRWESLCSVIYVFFSLFFRGLSWICSTRFGRGGGVPNLEVCWLMTTYIRICKDNHQLLATAASSGCHGTAEGTVCPFPSHSSSLVIALFHPAGVGTIPSLGTVLTHNVLFLDASVLVHQFLLHHVFLQASLSGVVWVSVSEEPGVDQIWLEVLTAVTVKMAVVWVVAAGWLVRV
jgi:hypothetical protein